MTQAEAMAAFRELSTPLEKLEKLIREDCACYERGEDWFRVVIRERDLIPELDEMARSAEETLATLRARLISRARRAAAYVMWHHQSSTRIRRRQRSRAVSRLRPALAARATSRSTLAVGVDVDNLGP